MNIVRYAWPTSPFHRFGEPNFGEIGHAYDTYFVVKQWCQLSGFPRFWACFLWSCVFFKTCGLLVFGLVLIEICLFFEIVFADFCFEDCFFSNFMALSLFQFARKGILGVFLWKFVHFGLVFSDLPPWFFIWFSCWYFVLLDFPANTFWACSSVKLPMLACFSNLLACFCKITWHHCCKEVREGSILLTWNCNVKFWCYLMLKTETILC